jgi:hypothetical protein
LAQGNDGWPLPRIPIAATLPTPDTNGGNSLLSAAHKQVFLGNASLCLTVRHLTVITVQTVAATDILWVN